jgi:hypothetical protein
VNIHEQRVSVVLSHAHYTDHQFPPAANAVRLKAAFVWSCYGFHRVRFWCHIFGLLSLRSIQSNVKLISLLILCSSFKWAVFMRTAVITLSLCDQRGLTLACVGLPLRVRNYSDQNVTCFTELGVSSLILKSSRLRTLLCCSWIPSDTTFNLGNTN